MIAHFVGGPLNGKDRAVDDGRMEIEVYELPKEPIVPSWEKEYPKFSDVEFHDGRYKRVRLVGQSSSFPTGSLPRIFVWVDERPFKFVVTVDAVPGADRELALDLVRTTARHAESMPQAFTGGIRSITVEE